MQIFKSKILLESKQMGRIPNVSRPSSVRVPVLSKHMMLTFPETLIFGGEMQKISFFLSLFKNILNNFKK